MSSVLVQGFEDELNGKEKALDEARDLCKKLCDKIKESASKSDLKNKLTSVERPLNDISKKIGRSLNQNNDIISNERML